ncbi:hypothetical protein BJ963_002269 [Leifsonia soli]|uniref:Uncharacterized protein n=1 Tax=Leifsonia soli TaxID=582665 RepID=A0A852T2C0_9MICO|nr:hypothetical protein [Leifsonia soli]
MNYDALERELTGHAHGDDEQYAKWAEYEAEDETESEDAYAYEDEDEETGTPKRA